MKLSSFVFLALATATFATPPTPVKKTDLTGWSSSLPPRPKIQKDKQLKVAERLLKLSNYRKPRQTRKNTELDRVLKIRYEDDAKRMDNMLEHLLVQDQVAEPALVQTALKNARAGTLVLHDNVLVQSLQLNLGTSKSKIIAHAVKEARKTLDMETAVYEGSLVALWKLCSERFVFRRFPLQKHVNVLPVVPDGDVILRILLQRFTQPIDLSRPIQVSVAFDNLKVLRVLLNDERATPKAVSRVYLNAVSEKNIPVLELILQCRKMNQVACQQAAFEFPNLRKVTDANHLRLAELEREADLWRWNRYSQSSNGGLAQMERIPEAEQDVREPDVQTNTDIIE